MSKQAEQEARDELLRVIGEMTLRLVEHTPDIPAGEVKRLKESRAQAGVRLFAAMREPEPE